LLVFVVCAIVYCKLIFTAVTSFVAHVSASSTASICCRTARVTWLPRSSI
jgi:hypothetical protein